MLGVRQEGGVHRVCRATVWSPASETLGSRAPCCWTSLLVSNHAAVAPTLRLLLRVRTSCVALQVLGVGLQRLMDRADRPLPTLYVRAMLLSLNAFPRLREKIVELLAELASPVRQVREPGAAAVTPRCAEYAPTSPRDCPGAHACVVRAHRCGRTRVCTPASSSASRCVS